MRDGASAGVTAPRVVVERRSPRSSGSSRPDPRARPRSAGARGRDSGTRACDRGPAPHGDARTHPVPRGPARVPPAATETIGLSALPDGEAIYATQILAFTTLPLEAREVHELGLADLETIQDERRRSARALGHQDAEAAVAALNASGRNGAGPARSSSVSQKPRSRRAGRRRLRTSAACRARTARFGLSRSSASGTCVRLLQPAVPGREPTRRLLRERLRPRTQAPAPPRVDHLPRSEPRSPLPDRARAGDDRSPALRRFGGVPGRSSLLRGLGAVQRATRRRDGALRGRGRASRHARGSRDASGPPGGRHGHPRVRVAAGTRHHPARGGGGPARGRRDRGRSLHHDARAGPGLQDRAVRDRAAARRVRAARGGPLLAQGFHDRLLSLGTLPLPALRRELGA